MRAADLMTASVLSVGPETSLRTVARIMVRERLGSMCVVTDTDELLGLITEADLLTLSLHPDPTRHLVPVDVAAQDAPQTAREVMTTEVFAVPPDADVADVARVMLDRHLTRIPIVEGKRLIGVLSRSDLLRPLCRDDEQIAEELCAQLGDIPGEWSAAVAEGRVTLSGPADSPETELAARIAWRVPGVVDVTTAGT
jgi:CBS domain-containing protein